MFPRYFYKIILYFKIFNNKSACLVEFANIPPTFAAAIITIEGLFF